jgi:hypothetical protein
MIFNTCPRWLRPLRTRFAANAAHLLVFAWVNIDIARS